MLVNVCRVGFMSDVTLGAVVSTGYHGSGLSFGALEDYVRRRILHGVPINTNT